MQKGTFCIAKEHVLVSILLNSITYTVLPRSLVLYKHEKKGAISAVNLLVYCFTLLFFLSLADWSFIIYRIIINMDNLRYL